MKYILFIFAIFVVCFIVYKFIQTDVRDSSKNQWEKLDVKLSFDEKQTEPMVTLQITNTGSANIVLDFNDIGSDGLLGMENIFNIRDEKGNQIPFIQKEQHRPLLNRVTSFELKPGNESSVINTINLANYYNLDIQNHTYTVQYIKRYYYHVPIQGSPGGKAMFDVKSNTIVIGTKAL